MYNINYFIKKFIAIPTEKWWEGELHNYDGSKSCALGHCTDYNRIGNQDTPEMTALLSITAIHMFNDNWKRDGYKGPKHAVVCHLIKEHLKL